MALRAILDTLDGVPATLHGEYTKGDDGKFRLAVEDAEEAFASGLKANSAKLLSEKAKLEARLRDLTAKLGDKPEDRLTALLSLEEKSSEEKAKSEGKLDEWKQEVVRKHGEERSTWQKREQQLLGAIEATLGRAELVRALAAAKGDAALLVPHGMRYLRVVEDGGAFKVEVIDPETKKALVKDGSGTPQSIEDVVATLRKAFPRAFDGTGNGGGDASGSGGRSGGGGSIPATLPPEERLRLAREQGGKS